MRWELPTLFLVALTVSGCNSVNTAKLVPPAKHIASVVSLSPSTTEIIETSTVANLLAGRTAADDSKSVATVPIVASVKPDYEAIRKIKPDLVLYDSLLYNPQDVSKINALGIPTFVITANTVKDFENQIYQLGDMLGSQTNFSDYVDRIAVASSTALGSKPTVPPKVAILMPGHGGSDMIAGTKSFISDAVSIAGGTEIGPPLDRFVPLSPEMLVTENPDVIVIPSSDATAASDAAEILHDPKLASTNAVKNKRIAAIDSDVILRRGNRVDKLITNLARAFAMGAK